MTNDFDLSIREIDDLLQHLYLKLRGKKEGLSLAEPAAILLAQLKSANPAFYTLQLARFTPIIMDTFISEAYISFGYEGLKSLNEVVGDIELATGDYIPAGVEAGLSRIRKEIESISAVLKGNSPEAGPMVDIGGKSETGTGGFFRESAWGTVGLPLVSTYNTGKTPFSTGRVIKARVEIRITGEWSIRKKFDPAITFDHISAEPNSIFESQIHTAVRIAENYAATVMGIKGILRVPREYRISLPEIASFPASAIQRLSGGSAGLAITALLISVLSSLDLYRHRLKFDNCTSFTGKVDPDGKILAVEDSHIAEKVRAVFFSRFSKLILPADNVATAEKELAALSGKYPSRKLDLVPAPDVAGMFRDSRVTERSMTPAGKPLLQRLFMWRKHLFAAASLTALIIVLLLIVQPYFRRDIAKVTASGNRITITNKFGRLITDHELDFAVAEGKNDKNRIFIGDFDGNGDNEALCVLSDSRHLNSSSRYNRLHFISFDNEGLFRFSYIYDDEELLGDQMNPDGAAFALTSTLRSTVFRNEQGGSNFLALVHHASRRPGSVINLSLEDFSRQIFLHQGYLFHIALEDVDFDGIPDVVLSGYNNILKSCVVVVLDQRYMQGSSPEGKDYDIPEFEKDIAKYYLRLPDFSGYGPNKNDWFPFVPTIKKYQEGLIVSVHNMGNNIRFYMSDNMECVRTEVLESLGDKGIQGSDSLAGFDYPEKKRDEEALRTGIRYWDGEDWAKEPTMNRSYLAQAGVAVDSTIAQIDDRKNLLVMKNRLGIVIATYDVGFMPPKKGSYRRVFFGDFLEDEGDEIVCAFFNSRELDVYDPARNKLFILIFDKNGRPMHRYVYDEAALMGPEMERTAVKVAMQTIRSSAPFSEEFGQGYLFIGTHHKTEAPASLIRFTLEDGLNKTFLHKGFLSEIGARDIDGDGNSELLLTGYNISLDAPVLVVLDPDHIDGSSPRGDCYSVPGKDRDIAKYYVRLPSFHLFERFPSWMYPLHAKILHNADTFSIIVESRAEDVIYTIGENMAVIDAKVVLRNYKGRNQPFSITAVEYAGKEQDEKELLEGVRFWDGENWVAEPTINRSYLKHVGEGD